MPARNKWIAASIVAALSTGLYYLMRYLSGLMREGIIEKENLGDILAQIKQADIDVSKLVMVLRESPPAVFMFIGSIVSVAITVWFYHKALGIVCQVTNNKNDSNQSSEPT